jgi:hypothetical protein
VPPPADFKNWNLNGHDANDNLKKLITPDAWYNFEAKQHRKRKDEQNAKGTEADRVVKEDGGFDATDNGKVMTRPD